MPALVVTEPARSTVLLTGSELTRGAIQDANGAFLAAELTRLNVPPMRIVVVGDDPDDLTAALSEGLKLNVLVVSGGLGPTHDDRTVELLCRAAGIELRVDEALESQIAMVSRDAAERLKRPYHDFEPGVRKQATIPSEAQILGLAGTAPGLILRAGAAVVVVLPGPPGELRRLWPRAVEHPWLDETRARTTHRHRSILRLYGVSESAVAGALQAAGGETRGLEVGICARDFEIHVDISAEVAAEEAASVLEDELARELERYLFARDHRTVEQLVVETCIREGLTLATAESCTGGLVGARLTGVPGASAAYRGGVVAYDNEVKKRSLLVPEPLLQEHGAVSAEAAEAMAEGVCHTLQADVGVSVTGIAGPDGGSDEKPVGLVHLHVHGPSGGVGQRLEIPGDREAVRARATAAALHLVRRILTQT